MKELEEFLKKHKKSHFLQSPEWSKVKKEWKNEFIIIRDKDKNIKGTMSLLLRKVPVINRYIMYAPRGFVCDIHDKETLFRLTEEAKKITTLTSGETFYAYCEGYALKDGLPDIKKINSENNGYIPDYMLAIPEQVQGMCFTHSGKLIFSTSYGRKNNSKNYVYEDVLLSERVGFYTIDGTEIDLLACGSDLLSKTIVAPPMAEGIVQVDSSQYIIFESGAEKYRNHRGKYPTDTAFKGNIE